MEEIKNCPLCGSHANLESFERNGAYLYTVRCSDMKCRLRSVAIKVGKNERFEGKTDVDVTPVMAINYVVKAWNTRTEKPCHGNTETAKRVSVRRIGIICRYTKCRSLQERHNLYCYERID